MWRHELNWYGAITCGLGYGFASNFSPRAVGFLFIALAAGYLWDAVTIAIRATREERAP